MSDHEEDKELDAKIKAREVKQKEKELARMLNMDESTVKGAKIPPVMLEDLHKRASRGEKISKFVKKPGAAVALTSVFGSAVAMQLGSDIGGWDGLAYGLSVIALGGTGTLAGGAAFGTGALLDRRKPVRRTVNTMALGRLAELEAEEERKKLPAPPKPKFELK